LAGIRYDGNYRLVYLAFASLENVSNQNIRRTILERSIYWMTGFKLTVTKVNDTEIINVPFPVTTNITSRDSIKNVYLAWSKNSERPFHKILMTLTSPDNYSADIPAPVLPGDIEYRIIAETNKGILPNKTFAFTAGPDTKPPVLTVNTPVAPSLKLNGPFRATVDVTDNIAVDKDSVFIYFKKSGELNEQRAHINYLTQNSFADTFSLASPAVGGQNILYYFTARDSTSNKNLSRYPASGYSSFVIGREVVEKFDNGSLNWNLGQHWALTDTFKNSGIYSITDSPHGNYLPYTKDTLTMLQGVNLSPFSGGWVKYWLRRSLQRGDTCFIDISRNNVDWSPIKFYKMGFPPGATVTQFDSIPIDSYYGSGNEAVQLRFRFVADSALQADGVYIDDIEFISTESTLDVKTEDQLPTDIHLYQNYPNPFNPTTMINYQLPVTSHVSLKVYNLLGQEVATIVDELQNAGYKQVVWNATNNYGNKVSSGVYFYRIEITDNSQPSKSYRDIKKMLIIK
jgi:hypothetical protein